LTSVTWDTRNRQGGKILQNKLGDKTREKVNAYSMLMLTNVMKEDEPDIFFGRI